MLFKPYHIDQIRAGEKTVTRREWDTPQVKVGGVYIAATERYTSHEDADCYVQVTGLYEQPLGEVDDADARREGDYDSLSEFIEGYERVYGEDAWDPEKVVWVVEFEYVGREKPHLTSRAMGCPNCDIPGTLEDGISTLTKALVEATESEVLCEYHLDELNAETREYMEAKT